MRIQFFRPVRFYGLALLLSGGFAPGLRAQAMQDWSAIEAVTRAPLPGKTAVPKPVTMAVQGPAAGLLPNALQPAAQSRLKSEAVPLTAVLPTLAQLRPVRFTFLPGQGEDGPQYGLLPSNLARVYPELVRTNLMNGTQTINTAQLTPILVEAIKELNAQLLLLQGQQLQLAEAYARLVAADRARDESGSGSLLRRRSASRRPGKSRTAGPEPAEGTPESSPVRETPDESAESAEGPPAPQ